MSPTCVGEDEIEGDAGVDCCDCPVQAQSGSPGVSLLDATTEYSAQLAAVKKNFESLKRGLAQAQSEAPPLPKPSHQSVRGQFHSSGGQPSTRRSQSVPMKPLTTSNAPFARNATQNKQQYDRERFARTVSQRATTSQVNIPHFSSRSLGVTLISAVHRLKH